MNKLSIILIINVLLFNLGIAQSQKETLDLSNSLPGLWHKGKTEKALESSLELYRLQPSMFIERIHETLAKQLLEDSKQNAQEYLEQLFKIKNEEINKIIAPIYLWSRAINATNENDLKKVAEDLNNMLSRNANYKSKAERYCLLILQELDKKNAIDNKSKERILQRNISNLEKYPYIRNLTPRRAEGEKRSWHRYLLAYSYNYLFMLKPNMEEYLKKASEYSPDKYDRQSKHAYFYEASLLTGNTKEVGFQLKYQKYLAENKRNQEALELLANITFANPSDENLKSLRDYYEQLKNTISFEVYWRSFVNKMGKPVPKLKIKFENEQLNLANKPRPWIYLDFWGTWCYPCRKELPELQSFYVENKTRSDLKIYTFSYNSKNLQAFMTENKYTFPVSEIGKETTDLFGVKGFPTKILISPEGNYIEIPFGENWKLYIKNYTLM